jgi:hypothetical protein
MENIDNNKFTVTISNKATEMLISHARFLANVSEEAAQSLIDDFMASSKSLETFPNGNPWFLDSAIPVNKYRKLLFCKRYLMIYQIKNDRVFVDYIVDCRQDYRWLL